MPNRTISPFYDVENPSPGSFYVYGNYTEKGKPVRFLAAQTWTQERADKWIAEHGITDDGQILLPPNRII